MAKSLNIQAARGARAVDAPFVIAPDGTKYTVGGMTVDSYLQILDLEARFEDLRAREKEAGGKPDRQAQTDLFHAFCEMVTVVLPGFPASALTLDELFEVIAFVQSANSPEPEPKSEEGAGDAPVGEPS